MTSAPHPFFQSSPAEASEDKQRPVQTNAPQGAFFGAPPQLSSGDPSKTLKFVPQPGPAKACVSAAESFSSSWFGGENSNASSVFDNLGIATPSQGAESHAIPSHPQTAHPLPQQLPGSFFAQQSSHDPFYPSTEERTLDRRPSLSSIAHLSSELFSETGEANFIGDETFEQLSTASASFSNVGDASTTFGNSCPRCRKMNDPSSVFCNRCGLQLSHGTGYTPPIDLSSLTLHDKAVQPPSKMTRESIYTAGSPVSRPEPPQWSASSAAEHAVPQESAMRPDGEQRPGLSSGPLVSFAFPAQPTARPTQLFPIAPASAVPPSIPSQPYDSRTDHHQRSMPSVSLTTAASAHESTPRRRAYPVFCFGFGDQVFVTFPLKQMRYAVNQPIGTGSAQYRPGPLYRCTLRGLPNIKVRLIDPVLESHNGLPLEEKYIRSKDVVKMLEGMLAASSPATNSPRNILLMLLQLILSHRGGLKAIPEESLSKLLVSEAAAALQDFGRVAPHPSDPSPSVVAEVARLLSKGDRSNAVLLAVSHQMWAVALMIASHVDRETYCATVSEFARRSFPAAHPLRTLFLLFAGQGSLAGVEMQQLGSSIKASWSWILSTIISNRTADDFVAITGLGDALLKAGEVFAAHVCYILSDDASLISSAVDPNCRIVYLGRKHDLHPTSFHRDWSSLRLTEVLEYTLKQASGGHCVLNHLQPYKIVFAHWLSDLGLSDLALKYCETLQESSSLRPDIMDRVKVLRERLSRHLGVSSSRQGTGEGGWLPKMGGLLERVIGVGSETEDVVTELAADAPGHRWSVHAESSLYASGIVPPAVPMFHPMAPPPSQIPVPPAQTGMSSVGSESNCYDERWQHASSRAESVVSATIPAAVPPPNVPHPPPMSPSMPMAASTPRFPSNITIPQGFPAPHVSPPQPPQQFMSQAGGLQVVHKQQRSSMPPPVVDSHHVPLPPHHQLGFSIAPSPVPHSHHQQGASHHPPPGSSQIVQQPPPGISAQPSHHQFVPPASTTLQEGPVKSGTSSASGNHPGPLASHPSSLQFYPQAPPGVPQTHLPTLSAPLEMPALLEQQGLGVPRPPVPAHYAHDSQQCPPMNRAPSMGGSQMTPRTHDPHAHPAIPAPQLPVEASLPQSVSQLSFESSSAPASQDPNPFAKAAPFNQGAVNASSVSWQPAPSMPPVSPQKPESSALPAVPTADPHLFAPTMSNAPPAPGRQEPPLPLPPQPPQAASWTMSQPGMPMPGTQPAPHAPLVPVSSMPPPAPAMIPPPSSPALHPTAQGAYQQGTPQPPPSSVVENTFAAQPSPSIGSRNEEEDDLGFGNKSLSRGKPQGSQQAASEEQDDSKDAASDAKGQEKKGVFGFFSGFFGKKAASGEQAASGAKQANLGEPSTFRYDEKLKRWVDTKEPQSTQTAAVPPPPPAASLNSMPSMMNAGDGAPTSFRRGATRSARSKYVDPLNPEAAGDVDAPPPIAPIPMAAPLGGNQGPTAPTMMPLPLTVPAPAPSHPHASPPAPSQQPMMQMQHSSPAASSSQAYQSSPSTQYYSHPPPNQYYQQQQQQQQHQHQPQHPSYNPQDYPTYSPENFSEHQNQQWSSPQPSFVSQ